MLNEAARLYAASDMYQLLSKFMFRTELELASALCEGTVWEDARSIFLELGVEEARANAFAAGLSPDAGCLKAVEEAFHALRKDFTHLFSNPSFCAIRIHESEFLGEAEGKNARNMSLNAIARDAKERYAKMGGDLMGAMSDQPDHMGLELRYMQVLRCAQASAIEGGDLESALVIAVEANDFFDTHVCSWAPAFFSSIEGEAQTDAYRSIGAMGRAFMELELCTR